MTGQNTSSGSFNEAVDALQYIITSRNPVGSSVVGPKSMSIKTLVPSQWPELYIETLNDVAKGLTADEEHPAWTDLDREEGMHALGIFLLSFKAKNPDFGEGGHFQYDRNDLIVLLKTLLKLRNM